MTSTNNATDTQVVYNSNYSRQLGYLYRANDENPGNCRVIVIADHFARASKQGKKQIDTMIDHALDAIGGIANAFFNRDGIMSRSQIVWHESSIYKNIELNPMKKALWMLPEAIEIYRTQANTFAHSVNSSAVKLMLKIEDIIKGVKNGDDHQVAIEDLLRKALLHNVEELIKKFRAVFAEAKKNFDQMGGETPEKDQERRRKLQEKVFAFFMKDVLQTVAAVDEECSVKNQINQCLYRFIDDIKKAKEGEPVSIIVVTADYDCLSQDERGLLRRLSGHKFVLLTPIPNVFSVQGVEAPRTAGNGHFVEKADGKTSE